MNRNRALVALLLSCTLSACKEWDPAYQQPWSLLPPVALESQMAFVERVNARVFIVDPAHLEAPARVVPVGVDPALAVRRTGKDELLVLSRGERGAPGVRPSPASLALIPADAGKPIQTLPLASRFNALTQSDDGRFLIAHFARGTNQGESLFNPNEIAIVDLAAPQATAVPRTIRSFGSVPTGVVFSPTMELPEGPRTLAVILSDDFVTIVDLMHPERAEITVPLTLPDDTRTLRPVQVLFDTKDAALFVRAENANDIYSLRLLPVPLAERTAGRNDFTPALSQLAAGSAPGDMALIDAEDGHRLLVVSPGSSDAFVIDARSSRSTRIPLDAPANRIFVFQGEGPGDPKVRQRALLLGANLESRSVTFLDLDQIELQQARNVDGRSMGANATGALFFPERSMAVVLHRSQRDQPGVSVIDLLHRTVAPIFAETPPAQVALAPAGADKIWVAGENSERLGFINLTTLAPGEVWLDDRVQGLYPLTADKDGKRRLVVVHPDPLGSITVLDGNQPDRATARSARGFLLQDLLERGDR